MAVFKLLPCYGEIHARCGKRQAGRKLFMVQLSLSKVSVVMVVLLLFVLATILSSWLSLAIRRGVSIDNSIYTSEKANGAKRTIGRRLLGVLPLHEQKKQEAMNKLEDVLLEPPRAASERSRTYHRRMKYLPDLMGEDSLKSYPRRVFIDVGPWESDGAGWLERTYPTRGQEFEKYERKGNEEEGMSEWMRERVREEEFVVMKAEAEDVEELVKSKAIRLVDELFLECKTKNNTKNKNKKKKKKAYWECLALYGKLRDQGVAVHQWWG
ncbi:hypothetical protein MLD38_001999 [Melastoma candidum]|uniref:Uncharacterized protein n=1 Tax=Melastoma candidum TaxID=119954 RepID=A0ACB9SEY3_9MYRT|nr:hypothetical protein MLD38_001999 [Melastoma candidum]